MEADINSYQNGPNQRHTKVGLQQLWNVRSYARNPVPRLNTGAPKRIRQIVDAFLEFRIAVLPLPINHRCFVAESNGRTLKKSQGSELADVHWHGAVALFIRPCSPFGVSESHSRETFRCFGESH